MNPRFLPSCEPVVLPNGQTTAGSFVVDDENEFGPVSHSAIAWNLAYFFAKLNGKGLSRAAWLVQHYLPNRHQRRKARKLGRKEAPAL